MQDAGWSKCDKLNSCMQINVVVFFFNCQKIQ